jgi:putative ABC transport system ATP-binding protein
VTRRQLRRRSFCHGDPAVLLKRFFAQRLLGLAIVVTLGFTIGVLVAGPIYADVELPLRVSGTDLKESKARAEMWLARLGLGDRMHNRTFELSAGQQQRVAVARALIGEPEVVLADEPIAEVDTENADLILEALWEVIRRGGAVLAATHNPEALRFASRVVLFRDGKVEAEGRPDEISARLTVD